MRLFDSICVLVFVSFILGLQLVLVEGQVTCGTNCSTCSSPINCTRCKTTQLGPSPDGSCGACSANCRFCTTNGAGNCDSCIAGYRILADNKTCEACSVANCSTCTGGPCISCVSGSYLENSTTPQKCLPCGDHCTFCNTNKGLCDPSFCSSGYTFDAATKSCLSSNASTTMMNPSMTAQSTMASSVSMGAGTTMAAGMSTSPGGMSTGGGMSGMTSMPGGMTTGMSGMTSMAGGMTSGGGMSGMTSMPGGMTTMQMGSGSTQSGMMTGSTAAGNMGSGTISAAIGGIVGGLIAALILTVVVCCWCGVCGRGWFVRRPTVLPAPVLRQPVYTNTIYTTAAPAYSSPDYRTGSFGFPTRYTSGSFY